MPDPKEAHRRRGAHWTFDGERFLREVAAARRSGRGSFPGFDHAIGDPVENAWQVLCCSPKQDSFLPVCGRHMTTSHTHGDDE